MNPKYTTDIEQLAKEVEVSYYRGSGPGGQHRNKTETGVRLFHEPSGLTIRCCDTRSQSGNHEIALKRLSQRLIFLNRPPKRRVKTRPTRASRERRLKNKQIRSKRKSLRGRISREE